MTVQLEQYTRALNHITNTPTIRCRPFQPTVLTRVAVRQDVPKLSQLGLLLLSSQWPWYTDLDDVCLVYDAHSFQCCDSVAFHTHSNGRMLTSWRHHSVRLLQQSSVWHDLRSPLRARIVLKLRRPLTASANDLHPGTCEIATVAVRVQRTRVAAWHGDCRATWWWRSLTAYLRHQLRSFDIVAPAICYTRYPVTLRLSEILLVSNVTCGTVTTPIHLRTHSAIKCYFCILPWDMNTDNEISYNQ